MMPEGEAGADVFSADPGVRCAVVSLRAYRDSKPSSHRPLTIDT